jgi:hypothetical protein
MRPYLPFKKKAMLQSKAMNSLLLPTTVYLSVLADSLYISNFDYISTRGHLLNCYVFSNNILS